MQSSQNELDLGHFVLHLHGCCLHKCRNENLNNALFNGEYSGQDDSGRWILLLLQPRWCPDCIQERSHAITIAYDQRILELEDSTAHFEQVMPEAAYLKGIRDGRIDVLSTSFAELPGWHGPERAIQNAEVDEKLNEVMEMLDDMQAVTRVKGYIEQDEELAEIMGRKTLGGDELDEAFEQAFRHRQEYQKGLEEGKKEQSEKEWAAMCETDWDKRRYLLEMALV